MKTNIIFGILLIELAILFVVIILLFIRFDYQTAFYGMVDAFFILITLGYLWYLGLQEPVPTGEEMYNKHKSKK